MQGVTTEAVLANMIGQCAIREAKLVAELANMTAHAQALAAELDRLKTQPAESELPLPAGKINGDIHVAP